jgi:hypothetical protein
VIQYPLDLTGVHPDNLVLNEPHGPCYPGNRVFVASYGPFYSKSLVVRNASTSAVLTPGLDYKALQTFIEPTLQTGKLIVSIVQIEPSAYGIPLVIDCQVLGGDYSLSNTALETLLDNLNDDDRPVHWGEIIGKPTAYPPAAHLHDIGDTFGWQYVVAALEAIRQALMLGGSGNLDDVYAYINLKFGEAMTAVAGVASDLSMHINNFNNPHQVTKSQIGLSLVGNYPLATPAIAALNESNETLISPYLVPYAMQFHTTNYNNPHQVSKDQVGLGNVDNYDTATNEQALEGTRNDLFVTPYQVNLMIQALLDAEPPGPPATAPTANFNASPPSGAFSYSVDTDNEAMMQSLVMTYSVGFYNSSVQGTNPFATIDPYFWEITGGDLYGTESGAYSTPPSGELSASFYKQDKNTFYAYMRFTRNSPSEEFQPISRTISLTAKDSTGLTHTKTSTFTWSPQVNYYPPPDIGYIRINGIRTSKQPGYNYFENFYNKKAGNAGVNVTHNFTVDVSDYFIGKDPDDYTVTWHISNATGFTTHVYVNNESGYTKTFSVTVPGNARSEICISLKITDIRSGLSTSLTGYGTSASGYQYTGLKVIAKTVPGYVQPVLSFTRQTTSDSYAPSVTDLTVTRTNGSVWHDINFVDWSTNGSYNDGSGVSALTNVYWEAFLDGTPINLGRLSRDSSNWDTYVKGTPGEWVRWQGLQTGYYQQTIAGIPKSINDAFFAANGGPATRTLKIVLTVRRYDNPSASGSVTPEYVYAQTSQTFSIVTNQPAGTAPVCNFTAELKRLTPISTTNQRYRVRILTDTTTGTFGAGINRHIWIEPSAGDVVYFGEYNGSLANKTFTYYSKADGNLAHTANVTVLVVASNGVTHSKTVTVTAPAGQNIEAT